MGREHYDAGLESTLMLNEEDEREWIEAHSKWSQTVHNNESYRNTLIHITSKLESQVVSETSEQAVDRAVLIYDACQKKADERYPIPMQPIRKRSPMAPRPLRVIGRDPLRKRDIEPFDFGEPDTDDEN